MDKTNTKRGAGVVSKLTLCCQNARGYLPKLGIKSPVAWVIYPIFEERL